MATLQIRLLGRFVFAEPRQNGTPVGRMNIVAVNMGANKKIRADPHHPLLIVPRRNVILTRRTLPPTFGIVPKDFDEYHMWSLEKHSVELPGSNQFQWSNADRPLTLPTDGDCTFNPACLQTPQHHRPVAATIVLRAGTATASFFDNRKKWYELVRLKDHLGSTGEPKLLYEVVTVDVPVTSTSDPVRLRVRRFKSKASSDIVIGNFDEAPVCITFSNVCVSGAREYDDEFAGMYEVLKNPPNVPVRLIPRTSGTHGRISDCYPAAYVTYNSVRGRRDS
ncbi:MAG TPA: hypothetical protein VFX12_14575 [Vicinamibacterales bacterium]|nr:hypothetical protein [Vicinamibacterales bacterium]